MASPPLLGLAQTPPTTPPRNRDCWSKLPLDLMQQVFERLSFSDFQRAKSVCTSWQSGSRQSKPNNKIPWMILLQEDKNYVLLFNPAEEEEGKLYKTQHLGENFGNSDCLATYKSWLLMDPPINEQKPLYILNLFNPQQRINLPTAPLGRTLDSPILWIDDKTKDYFVIGVGKSRTLVYYFKNDDDNSWKQIISEQQFQEGIAFKDHMLYCLTINGELCVFDFSAAAPLQVSRVSVGIKPEYVDPPRMRLPDVQPHVQEVRKRNNVVVTVTGDVLIVRSLSPFMSETWNFQIFKIDDENEGKLEEIVSLGDEAILLDLGITVIAKDHQGFISNSLYFTGDDIGWYDTEIFVFNLDTNEIEQLPQHVSSSVSFSRARWFLPCFNNV